MNDQTNAPKPGSAEYDMEMAQRYRSQGKEAPLTESGLAASDYRQVTNSTGASIGVRKDSTASAPGETTFTAAQADPGQIADLEREIALIREELQRVHHYDPNTGEAVMLYDGEARRLRELRLAHLEHAELPQSKALVDTAQKWRTENVESPLTALIREKEEREAMQARAREIASERRAQLEATRILRGTSGLGIG